MTTVEYVKFDFMRSEVKFLFKKDRPRVVHHAGSSVISPVQLCWAYVRHNGTWRHVWFSREHPCLLLETEEFEVMSPFDPVFDRFRKLAFSLIEDRLRDFWQAIENELTAEEQFTDLQGLTEDFVPWQIEKVITSGDIDEGAEQVLFTEQGQQMLRDTDKRVTPRMIKKLAAARQHIIDHGEDKL